MRNRTKKEQKLLDQLVGFFILVVALVGWNLTESLMGTVITVGIGIVALILVFRWRSMIFQRKMQRSGIEAIDQMTGKQFEEYLGTLFQSQGYKVSYTSTTGDFGADIILNKGKESIVVQAKRYKKVVGIKAVQEVIPSINMYNANYAWVVTNSTYTRQALMLAKKNHVRMIDRNGLIQMSLEMQTNLNKGHNNGHTVEKGSTISIK